VAVVFSLACLLLPAIGAVYVGSRTAVIAFALGVSAACVLTYFARPYDLPEAVHLSARSAFVLAAAGILAAWSLAWQHAVILLAGSGLVIRLVQAFYYNRSGAITRTAPVLTCVIVEGFTLSYLQKALSPLGQ
jgi:hypothetical protein